VEEQKEKGGKLGAILIQLGYLTEDILLAILGKQTGVSYVSLQEYGEISEEAIKTVPETIAKNQMLVPIKKEGNVLTIAIADPLNVFAADDLKQLTGCEIKAVWERPHNEKIDDRILRLIRESSLVVVDVARHEVVAKAGPQQAGRDFGVRVKFNPVREVLDGKRVVVVDDSIVRGTTSRKLVRLLRRAGAREVHFRVGSPPVTHPCFYGIDTPSRRELIGALKSVEEIRQYLGVDVQRRRPRQLDQWHSHKHSCGRNTKKNAEEQHSPCWPRLPRALLQSPLRGRNSVNRDRGPAH